MVAFLVGPDGGWVNGQVLRANGGYVWVGQEYQPEHGRAVRGSHAPSSPLTAIYHASPDFTRPGAR